MRVLMVSQMTPFLPTHDGFRLLPAHLLAELGARCTLGLVAATSPAETPDQHRWARRYCAEVTLVPGERAAHPLTGGPRLRLPMLREATRRAIERFRPDLLHLEGAVLAPLARMAGIPTVLSVQDSLALRAQEMRRLAGTPWAWLQARWQERREAAWEQQWLGAADACVVLSEEDRAGLVRHVPFERVEVIPNGIDPDHYAYRKIGQPGRIVFAGNLACAPNADAALAFATRVFPRLRAESPRAEFVIAGASPGPAVRALAGLPGVRVTGTLPDLRPSIWSAAVSVSPIRAGLGMKNKILEAMALGTPIVATSKSLSGLSDVLPGHHVLRADDDHEAVAAVLLLLREPVVAATIAKNARDLVERRYTWRAVAGEYAALHARVADRAGLARVAA